MPSAGTIDGRAARREIQIYVTRALFALCLTLFPGGAMASDRAEASPLSPAPADTSLTARLQTTMILGIAFTDVLALIGFVGLFIAG